MYLTKNQLYQKVSECREELIRNGLRSPFSIQEICRCTPNICVDYAQFNTSGLRGMVSLATTNEPINCILINSELSKEEQHFHSMHEFMHIYLHSNSESKSFHCYDKIRPNQNSSLEWQANEGAAELIIPYRDFIPLFSKLYDTYQNKQSLWNLIYGQQTEISDVLSQRYFVSAKVIENRISNLSYEIDQYKRGISVDNIQLLSYNQRKNRGITATDYLGKLNIFSCRYIFAL